MKFYTDRMSPLSDAVFNYMFSDQNMKGSMREIINAVLKDTGDTQIGEVQKITTQYDVKKRGFGAHGGRVDVRAVTADGTLFDIEVQLNTEPAMNARSWFYGSGVMSEEFHEGMPYRQMPKVRIINLLDFTLRKTHPDYLQPIKMLYVKNPEEATDSFRIYNIELPKYRAQNPTLESVKDDPLKCWLYMLDQGYASDRELEVLETMTEGMQAFAEKYRISLTDPDLKRIYDLEQSAKRDQTSALYNARESGKAEGLAQGLRKGRAEGMAKGEARGLRKGRAEGLTQGRFEERRQIILSMLQNGLPREMIYRMIDAPQEEIDAIIGKMKKN